MHIIIQACICIIVGACLFAQVAGTPPPRIQCRSKNIIVGTLNNVANTMTVTAIISCEEVVRDVYVYGVAFINNKLEKSTGCR